MLLIRHVQLCITAALLGCSLMSTVHAAAVTRSPGCVANERFCNDKRMHPDVAEPDVPIGRATRAKLAAEAENEFWIDQGREFVRAQLNAKKNTGRAKNVILFLGDGMGVTTVAAARNLIGGEEQKLSFEHFPYTGLSKTYAVDIIVPDSACTATAYLGGVKAQEGTIGVNGAVNLGDCIAMLNVSTHVNSIAKWAMDAGKWAGVVTTTRITHASPSGVYAHIADRDWENDVAVRNDCGADSAVKDIAYQLINGEVGSKLKLMLGGGRKNFVDATLSAEGRRADGLNLIEQFTNESAKNVYVTTRDELLGVKNDAADRVLGLFQADHMLYHLETNASTQQPTLQEMTRKAIEYLSQHDEGYFIFIEGGRIDQAHHYNMARLALDETVEFSKAIETAREMTNEEDTLIVVTADHSHSFSFSGYPYRGNDIFGRTPSPADDGKPMMTLNYANGPSAERFFDSEKMERIDPTTLINGVDPHEEFPAGYKFDMETHGGDDVPVYASGPWAHLFTGVYEQNAIPHFMAYAACLGNGLQMCNTTTTA